ncbi:N-acetyl-1-D-myo-inositol-2-amino-2-deoxy-alpha-D-glucopyranoside deacetylase [Corynebacterium timonense]|uniref:1D-myo-inositol 2-acetamido-2-deoxy-alpha-D-glucopyranoside deacetylase n=1 Tax=Corynebacterium timonense TaxID=441500 RepID=A0A1H1QGS6_9CORY|nr:N-acetyl-1-D-myo-inositol-2-amino-2-deoxy-alpha-D-glucopyranoside deacetylase [Corynebacterium timonense]SDS22584.1 N-acetyl-1-D-myo-inositol-2-amino-2-deoxy-alpha-D-glucopyranoside deacetylase [Corynebacterium timonense]
MNVDHRQRDLQRDLEGYRVVAVHAHPDDESISTGGALADLSRRGADVLVVTCTLGEEGEVIGPTYSQLVADCADQLGGFRIHELHAALAALGVRGVFLGGAGRFRDSGMAGSEASRDPRAFVNSGQVAVDALADIFAAQRPHLVITYDPHGGYGHPDHIRAHEVAHAAAEATGVPRLVWAARLRSELEGGLPARAPRGWRLPEPGELDAVDATDTWVDLDEATYAAKVAAMRAHATQIWVADGSASETNPEAVLAEGDLTAYALSNLITQVITRREHYRSGAGVPLVPGGGLLEGVER